eukprot:jgi/Botrbrau1/4720/Bobra.0218s0036.1
MGRPSHTSGSCLVYLLFIIWQFNRSFQSELPLVSYPSPSKCEGAYATVVNGSAFRIRDFAVSSVPQDAAWWIVQVKDSPNGHSQDWQPLSLHQSLSKNGHLLARLIPCPPASPTDTVYVTEGNQNLAMAGVVALWSPSLQSILCHFWLQPHDTNHVLMENNFEASVVVSAARQSRRLKGVAPSPGPSQAPAPDFIGASFPFVGVAAPDGVLNGLITITGERTFRVSNLSYGGEAPAVYWRGAKVTDPGVFDGSLDADAAEMAIHMALLHNGTRLSPKHYTAKLNNAEEDVELPANITWNDINVISFYCEAVMADLAHGLLPPVSARAGPGPLLSHAYLATIESGAVGSYENCLDVWNGTYQLMWTLEKASGGAGMIQAALVAELPTAKDAWLSFGFADPSLNRTDMIGSDVVVAGLVGSSGCFAYDYYLSEKSQCDYATGKGPGVCPDAGLAGKPGDNNVELISCTKDNGVLTVEFRRPLKAQDQFDHDWPVGKPGFAVWAIGPLSEASTPAKPVVLFHSPLPKGPAQTTEDLLLDLGKPSKCSIKLVKAQAQGPSGAIAGAVGGKPQAEPRPTIQGVDTFVVTLGTNPNYPNPPGWGVAYHINDIETPVLQVERCKPYTFNVQAGGSHPLYITTSKIGGASTTDDSASAKIFAGGEDSHGSTKKPYNLVWTPAGDTPDVVYYQCYIHQKLGWMIKVTGTGTCKGSSSGALAPAGSARLAPSMAPGGAPAVGTLGTLASTTAQPGSRALAPASTAPCSLGVPPGMTGPVMYANCAQVATGPEEVRLLWKINSEGAPAPGTGRRRLRTSVAAGTNANVSIGVDAAAGQGWAAVGVPMVPGQMVGADALIIRSCPSCPSGATAEPVHLAQKSVAGILRPGNLAIDNLMAWKDGDRLKASFNTLLDPVHLFQQPFIYAVGPLTGDGASYGYHKSGQGGISVDLRSGSGSITYDNNTSRATGSGGTWSPHVPVLGIAHPSGCHDCSQLQDPFRRLVQSTPSIAGEWMAAGLGWIWTGRASNRRSL